MCSRTASRERRTVRREGRNSGSRSRPTRPRHRAGRGDTYHRVRSKSRSTRDSRASFFTAAAVARASVAVFRVFSRIVRSRSFASRCAASRHDPPSRVLLASPAPRSLAFAPPPRAADVSSALSLVPVAPALRHGLNSAPYPRVLGPLRSSCGCIRHVRQGRSSGWLEVPRRSRSPDDRTRPGGTRPRNRVSCPLGER